MRLKRLAAASSLAVALMAWGGAMPVSAALPLAGPLAICMADLPCLGTLMLVTAAAGGAVYAGSTASQKQGMQDFLAAGLSGIGTSFAHTAGAVVDNVNPCGFGWSGVCPTIAQAWDHIAGSIEGAIGSGASSVPLTQPDVNAVQATGSWLATHPLPSSIGDGTSDHVQSWGGDAGAAANLATYASGPQVVFYMDIAIPASASLICCSGLPRVNFGYDPAGFSGSPIYSSMANAALYWGYDGACDSSSQTLCPWLTSLDNRGGCNADQLPAGCVDPKVHTTWLGGGSGFGAGSAHVLHLQVMNEDVVGGGLALRTTGAVAVGTVGAYLYNGNNTWANIDGSLWYQHLVSGGPAAVAIPLAGVPTVDHLPKSVPLVPGSFVGAGSAGLGSLVSAPAATITNVAGLAVPAIGTAATAGSFAPTLAGVADAVAAVGQFAVRFFDFSIPVNWGRITAPIALMPSKFPFSIPFDVGAILASIFNVQPLTPNASVSWCFHSISICPSMTVAPFLMDTLMPFVRWAELVLLVVLCALGYRRWIGGAS